MIILDHDTGDYLCDDAQDFSDRDPCSLCWRPLDDAGAHQRVWDDDIEDVVLECLA